jgi:hypothetical protein
MMHVVYYTDTGEAFSIGSVLAVPMPPEFSVYTCTEDEGVALLSGGLRWDAASRTLAVVPPREPDDEETP